MSVEPDTPDEWRTITLQGNKCDIGPDATIEDLFEQLRYIAEKHKHSDLHQHKQILNARDCGLVRKETVGTDESENWLSPSSKDELVPYDCSTIEDGDELRAFQDPEWDPVYPEVNGS